MLVNLVQLRRDDIAPGVPLAFAVFDQERRLIYVEGQVIDSEDGINELIARGAYRTAANETRSGGDVPATQTPLANAQECSFEDMRLQAGDALQLQALSGKDRYYVRLVGYLPGRSVLVTAPTTGGRVLLMREGQVLIARAFSGRAAYAFNTEVERVCTLPYPYLHLAFPALVQGVPVRCEPRIRLRMTASVTRTSSPGDPVAVQIVDLSPSGARLDAPERLAGKGEIVRLSFRLKLEQDDAYFVNEAIVRSAREERRAGAGGRRNFLHGIEFVGMQPNERLLLRTLIYQRLAEGARE